MASDTIEVNNALKSFKKMGKSSGRFEVKALDNINIKFEKGKIVGLVGESGSGKTTLGLAIAGLLDLDSGKISVDGEDIKKLVRRQHGKGLWRKVQMIFQDPYESLNDRLTVRAIVSTPLNNYKPGISRAEKEKLLNDTLKLVGLDPPQQFLNAYPRSLSGGERQRVSIARAIISDPSFLIADEPVSMLDVSIRAGILEVLSNLRKLKSTAILFVSHDIAIASYLSDTIAVMHLGQIVEIGPPRKVLNDPKHPYTKVLLDSVPRGNGEFYNQTEDVDELKWQEMPGKIEGCSFVNRCPFAMERCSTTKPTETVVDTDHTVACFLFE